MFLGTSVRDITPQEPIELAGFSHRKGTTDEVLKKLYLKTFILEFESEIFLLLSADLIWWDTNEVDELKKEIELSFGIPKSKICFTATHNHSGPQTSSRFSRELGNPSISYLNYLRKQVIESVNSAMRVKEKVRMKLSKGSAQIGVYRRKMINGLTKMAPNFNEPVDDELTLVSFINDKNEYKGMWIHYACHPTSTDLNSLSSEYPGICCERIEEKLPGCKTAFLQGFCGDIRPKLIKGEKFYRGTEKDMVRFGEELFSEVMDLIEQDGDWEEPVLFSSTVINLPLKFIKEKLNIQVSNSLKEEWEQLVVKNKDYTLQMQYIKLSKNLSLFSCNAEMVQQYGIYIKDINKNVLPLGYSNGMLGYVPTSKQLEEGGYESDESLFYFGYPSKLALSNQMNIQFHIDLILKGES